MRRTCQPLANHVSGGSAQPCSDLGHRSRKAPRGGRVRAAVREGWDQTWRADRRLAGGSLRGAVVVSRARVSDALGGCLIGADPFLPTIKAAHRLGRGRAAGSDWLAGVP